MKGRKIMVNINDFLSIIFYIVIIALGISLLVLSINSIKTLNKFDRLLDDISEKSRKLDGVFSVMDSATDAFVNFSDSIVGFFTKTIRKVVKRKKEDNYE